MFFSAGCGPSKRSENGESGSFQGDGDQGEEVVAALLEALTKVAPNSVRDLALNESRDELQISPADVRIPISRAVCTTPLAWEEKVGYADARVILCDGTAGNALQLPIGNIDQIVEINKLLKELRTSLGVEGDIIDNAEHAAASVLMKQVVRATKHFRRHTYRLPTRNRTRTSEPRYKEYGITPSITLTNGGEFEVHNFIPLYELASSKYYYNIKYPERYSKLPDAISATYRWDDLVFERNAFHRDTAYLIHIPTMQKLGVEIVDYDLSEKVVRLNTYLDVLASLGGQAENSKTRMAYSKSAMGETIPEEWGKKTKEF